MPPLLAHPSFLRGLLVIPAPAVVVGVYVMLRHGVSPATVGLQVAAAILAGWVGAWVARLPRDKVLAWAPALAVGGLLCGFSTLVFPGLSDVHRWMVLGPLRVHASSLLAPLVLLGVAVLFEVGRPLAAAGVVLLMQALHLVQPDAAQATAFGAASLVLITLQPGGPLLRWGLGSVVLMCAALAWGRPDPLPPVPHVEGIVQLAAEAGMLWGLAALASLAVIPLGLALVGVSRRRHASPLARRVTACLAMYLGLQVLAPAFGHFPVPVLGFGISPLIGTWLSLGIVGVLGPLPEMAEMVSKESPPSEMVSKESRDGVKGIRDGVRDGVKGIPRDGVSEIVSEIVSKESKVLRDGVNGGLSKESKVLETGGSRTRRSLDG